MFSSLIAFVIIGTACVSASASELKAINDKLVVECRSQNVVDAGYSVNVFFEHGKYFGNVYELSYAGLQHQYYSGAFSIAKYNPAEHIHSGLKLKDLQDDTRKNLEIRILSNGTGQIRMLEGKLLSSPTDSFLELACQSDSNLF